MTLKDIAIKNLLRRKAKSGFILCGLIIAIATVVAVFTFVEAITSDINHKLEKFGANILITPKTDHLALTYGGLSLGGISFDVQEIQQDSLARISTIENAANVAAVGPMVLGAVSLKEQTVLLAGVDFTVANILKPWWQIDGQLPTQGELLVGSDAARRLQLKQGDIVTLNDQSMRVRGILKTTGSQDDQILFTPLAQGQALLNKPGRITMVEVAALCTACPVEEMVRQISAVLPTTRVMAIQQVVKGRMQTLGHLKQFSLVISGAVVLVGCLVVFVTMMSSVRERTREIGIFRAIGFKKRHIMALLWLEALVLGLLAGISGYGVGLGGAKAALVWYASEAPIRLALNLPMLGWAVAMALTMGLAATFYPARVASNLDPSEALRTI